MSKKYHVVHRGTEVWEYVYHVTADTPEEAEAKSQTGLRVHVASNYIRQGDCGEVQVQTHLTREVAPEGQEG